MKPKQELVRVVRGPQGDVSIDLTGKILFLADGPAPLPRDIRTGPRIGIDYAQEAVHFPWRFCLESQER